MTFEVPALAAGFASKFDEIGPYIGFGSLVAVVAMAILVFSQGRELQRLRDWAGTSPERLDALERELQDGQAGRLATPAPRPGVPVAAGAAAAVPGAPPRPPGAPGAAPPVPGAPGSPVVGAGSTTPPGAVGAPGAPRPTPPRPTPPGAPATRVLAASAAGGPRAATAAGAAASTARERERDGERPPRSVGQIVGVAVVALIVLVALLFAAGVFGGGGDKNAANNAPGPGNTTSTPARSTAPRYDASEMKTLVLNASGTSLIARTVSDKIDEKLRFPMGEPTNYLLPDGSPASIPLTTVQYRRGSDQPVAQNRAAATAIAKLLALGTTSRVVKSMSTQVQGMAPDRNIVVVVGQDYAAKNPPAGGSSTTPGAASGSSGTAGGATTTPGAATGGTTGGTTSTATDPSGTSGATGLTDPSSGLGTTDGTSGATTP